MGRENISEANLPTRRHLSWRRVASVTFWGAAIAILALTLFPVSTGSLNDKVAHFLSFLVLTLLGRWAWGDRHLLKVAIGLAIMGGTIELLQALPFIGRDAELFDFVADVAGIAIVVMILATGRIKGWT